MLKIVVRVRVNKKYNMPFFCKKMWLTQTCSNLFCYSYVAYPEGFFF